MEPMREQRFTLDSAVPFAPDPLFLSSIVLAVCHPSTLRAFPQKIAKDAKKFFSEKPLSDWALLPLRSSVEIHPVYLRRERWATCYNTGSYQQPNHANAESSNMSSVPNRKMSAAEYLQAERASSERNIFWGGEVFAMTGATREHNLIAGNAFTEIKVQLKTRPCESYMADMRVKNVRTGSYFYPDIVATCEESKFEDGTLDTLLNPQVIIEVLSKSTEAFDRGRKFEDCQLLDSLKEYILNSQDRMLVERFTRQTESTWEYCSSSNPDDTLVLNSIQCRIELAAIYAKVEFPDPDASDDGEENLKVIEEKAQFFPTS